MSRLQKDISKPSDRSGICREMRRPRVSVSIWGCELSAQFSLKFAGGENLSSDVKSHLG